MKRIIICIALIIVAVSCEREDVKLPVLSEREVGDSMSAVAFSSRIKTMGVSTKSAYISPSFDDAMISSVTLAVYEHASGVLYTTGHFTSDYSNMQMKLRSGVEYDIYALANMGDQTGNCPHNRSALLSDFTYTVPSYAEVNEKGIPMTGCIEHYIAGSGEDATLDLRRLFAKVVLNVTTEYDGGLPGGVVITDLRICNGNAVLNAFGRSAMTDASSRISTDDYLTTNTVNASSVVFYVPENRQGKIGNAFSSLDKNPDRNSEVNAVRDLLTYAEVTVAAASAYYTGTIHYRSYIGADETTDFDIQGNCCYIWDMTLTEDGLVNDDWKIDQDIRDDRFMRFLADPVIVESGDEVQWEDILETNISWIDMAGTYGGTVIYESLPDAVGFAVRDDVVVGDVMTATLLPLRNSHPFLEAETSFRVVSKYINFDSDVYEVNPRKTVTSFIEYGNSYTGVVTGAGGVLESDGKEWIVDVPEGLPHSTNGTNYLDYAYAYDSLADSVNWTPSRYTPPGDYPIVCRTMNGKHSDVAILRVRDTRWINTDNAIDGLPRETTMALSEINDATIWNIGYAFGDLSVSDDTGKTCEAPNAGFFAGNRMIDRWNEHIGYSLRGSAEDYLVPDDVTNKISSFSVTSDIPIGDYVYDIYWKDTWNDATATYSVKDSAVLHITGIYITSVSVSPSTLTVRKGETLSINASVQPRNASLKKVTWEVVSGGECVSVESTGDLQAAVMGLQTGTATVRAIAADGSGVQSRNVCTITVTNPPVSLAVLPAEETIYMGTSLPFRAIATLYDGSVADVTSNCRWTTSNRNIATVGNNDGVAVAGSSTSGICMITASYNLSGNQSLTATATLNVVARPTPVSIDYLGAAIYLLHNNSSGVSQINNTHNMGSLPLRLNYADGTSIIGTVSSLGATLSASDTDVISISGSSRIITGGRGITTVSISCDGQSVDVNVYVSSYRITPSMANSIYLVTGSSQTFNSYLIPYNQTSEIPFSVNWNVRNEPGYGQITVTNDYGSSTSVIGRVAGTAWLSVEYAGEYGTLSIDYTIQVQNGGGGSTTYYLEVSPESVTLNEGGTAQFTAKYHTVTGGNDDGGVAVQASWSISSGGSYISITSDGLVTAQSSGRARIMASYKGKTGYATVIVSNAPPVITHYLEVTPTESIVEVGNTLQFTAIYHTVTNGMDDGGVIVTPVWGSSDNAVATINAGGTATARARGIATIIASYSADGESYTAAGTLTVAQQVAEVCRIEITPAETTISEGATLTYVVRKYTDIYTDGILSFKDLTGVVIPNTDVAWSIVSGGSCATVNSSGIATGVSPGDVTVKATYRSDASVTATALLHIDNVYNVDPGTGGTGSGGGNY